MIVHLRDLLKKTIKKNCALGCFNTHNLETTQGILRAAENQHSPVIIGVSPRSIKYAGLKPITHIIKTSAKNLTPTVPVAFHLDHGKNFGEAIECIRAGFSSIMIDASQLPFDENVFQTKKVVEYARRYGVLVQGEIGQVPTTNEDIKRFKTHPKEFMTDPKEAEMFVKKTKVDTLAVGVGNIHGMYKMKHQTKIDWQRLKEIYKKTKIPLVLHGASGIKAEDIKKAIANGIKIINIHTEINIVFAGALRASLIKNTKEVDPRKIMAPVVEAVERMVGQKIKVFNNGAGVKNLSSGQ